MYSVGISRWQDKKTKDKVSMDVVSFFEDVMYKDLIGTNNKTIHVPKSVHIKVELDDPTKHAPITPESASLGDSSNGLVEGTTFHGASCFVLNILAKDRPRSQIITIARFRDNSNVYAYSEVDT